MRSELTPPAGEQYLRPIIMTSLAFALGCLPLVLALGAGANARHSIGTGIRVALPVGACLELTSRLS